eukprot:1161848-Pelagomonas_calceolata.AAC.6
MTAHNGFCHSILKSSNNEREQYQARNVWNAKGTKAWRQAHTGDTVILSSHHLTAISTQLLVSESEHCCASQHIQITGKGTTSRRILAMDHGKLAIAWPFLEHKAVR